MAEDRRRNRTDEDEWDREGEAAKRRRLGLSEVVAAHYNNIQERSIGDRYQSCIIHMRSFNNWIKSMLIGSVVNAVKGSLWDSQEPLTVLDFGVGKGGDLGKWSKHEIKHLIGFDIAAESLACCKSRYDDMQRNQRRFQGRPFTAEFHEADFTREKLSDIIDPTKLPADIVSCQFSFHYCFESFGQVDRTLMNVSECLRDGGYFFLTFPDAYNIMHRWQTSKKEKFGNRIFQIDFGQRPGVKLPLFGAKYRFSLEGVVDCPEFLVHFPTLVDIASRNGLELVYQKTFKQLFDEHSTNPSGRQLLAKMGALETYPSGTAEQRRLEAAGEYDHAKAVLQKFEALHPGDPDDGDRRRWFVGTLSKAEWDAASIYMAAVFKKTTVSAKGLAIDHDD